MHKETLRKEILAKRDAASSASLSTSICTLAASLPEFLSARTVMLYLAKGSEVDTARLLALSHRMGKTICAPRITGPGEMEAAILDIRGFRRGAFGILEPLGPRTDAPDIIFVPGTVFDTKGNRIGYGKGYYDRFLQAHPAYSVGLAYACQVVDSVPTLAHDVRLCRILTEEGICL